MKDWLSTLHDELLRGNVPIVRVVVATVRGSAPREAGACMLISASGESGTIGGGHLEFVATRSARSLLAESSDAARIDRFSLGASLGQCCGGIVELWFQRYDTGDIAFLEEALLARQRDARGVLATNRDCGALPRQRLLDCAHEIEGRAMLVRDGGCVTLFERIDHSTTELWLFGAGHVGRALVHVLEPLPFAITWVDSREGMLPADPGDNVRVLQSPNPAEEVRDMSPDAWALVMTHSHDEDFSLCQALLDDSRFGWAGVIGSAPKTRRFHQRLLQRGFSPQQVARLTMPIGIDGIHSKEAASIAVAVAAQLLRLREARRTESLVPAKRGSDPA